MQGARTQKEFRNDGMYGPINNVVGTMGSYGDAQTQQQFRNNGMYNQINAAVGTQNPKAQAWNRGINGLGAADPLRGPLETSTQAGVRQHNLYSHLYNSVGAQQPVAHAWSRGINGLGVADPLHSPTETRSPAGFLKHGMYNNLFNAAKPKSLSGYLGQAVSTTAPGILVVLAGIAAYFLFFKKAEPKTESASNETHVEAPAPAVSGEGASFYY